MRAHLTQFGQIDGKAHLPTLLLGLLTAILLVAMDLQLQQDLVPANHDRQIDALVSSPLTLLSGSEAC